MYVEINVEIKIANWIFITITKIKGDYDIGKFIFFKNNSFYFREYFEYMNTEFYKIIKKSMSFNSNSLETKYTKQSSFINFLLK